jgi:hypothetical protein
MIEIARSCGLPAKFPGSGGAIVGTYDDPARLAFATEALNARGYEVQPVTPTEEVVAARPEVSEEYPEVRRAPAGAFHAAARNGHYQPVAVGK